MQLGDEQLGAEVKKRPSLEVLEPARFSRSRSPSTTTPESTGPAGVTDEFVAEPASTSEQESEINAALTEATVALVSTTDELVPSTQGKRAPSKIDRGSFIGLAGMPASTKNPNFQSGPIQLALPDNDEAGLTIGRVARGLPSWFVSLIVHTLLIIGLALVTLAANKEPESVSIEIVPTSDVVSLDIVIEHELEENVNSLDVSEDLLLADEPPVEASSHDFGNMQNTLEDGDLASLQLGDGLGLEGAEISSRLAPAEIMTAKATGAKGVSYFGTKAYGDNFVFIVDCSGSMSERFRSYQDNTIRSRWDRAKQETKRSVSMLSEDQTFLVFVYNDKTHAMGGIDPLTAEPVPATAENKQKLYDWLEKGRPNADTYPMRSVELGLKLKPDAIFLMSDGEFGDNTARYTIQANLPRAWETGPNRKTPIHTVAFGKAGAKTLQWVAERNNGIFTQIEFK